MCPRSAVMLHLALLEFMGGQGVETVKGPVVIRNYHMHTSQSRAHTHSAGGWVTPKLFTVLQCFARYLLGPRCGWHVAPWCAARCCQSAKWNRANIAPAPMGRQAS